MALEDEGWEEGKGEHIGIKGLGNEVRAKEDFNILTTSRRGEADGGVG